MRGAGAKKHEALLAEIADIVDDRVVTNDIWFDSVEYRYCSRFLHKGIVLSLDRGTTYSLEPYRHWYM